MHSFLGPFSDAAAAVAADAAAAIAAALCGPRFCCPCCFSTLRQNGKNRASHD